MTLLGAVFLKKSGSTLFAGPRWQYLRAVRNGELPPPPAALLAEIEASPKDPRPTTDRISDPGSTTGP